MQFVRRFRDEPIQDERDVQHAVRVLGDGLFARAEKREPRARNAPQYSGFVEKFGKL